MKLVGDVVKLRCLWWDGKPPSEGDVLVTSTERRYLVKATTGVTPIGSSAFTIYAYVLPPNYRPPPGTSHHRWTWAKRSRGPKRRATPTDGRTT